MSADGGLQMYSDIHVVVPRHGRPDDSAFARKSGTSAVPMPWSHSRAMAWPQQAGPGPSALNGDTTTHPSAGRYADGDAAGRVG